MNSLAIRPATYSGDVLPSAVHVMFHPAQDGSVDFLLRGHVEAIAGYEIEDLWSGEETEHPLKSR